jgi:general secretion pathway protein G
MNCEPLVSPPLRGVHGWMMKLTIAILGLAVPLLAFGVGASPSSEECQISAVRANQAALMAAVAVYAVDTGAYPSEAQGLGVLITNPGVDNWRGPYLRLQDGHLPTDPWGHAFRYQLTNGVPVIDSPGPDGVFGTSDDNGKNIKIKTRTRGCGRSSLIRTAG